MELSSEENPGPSSSYCLGEEAAGHYLEILGSVSIMACASFYTAQLQRNVQQATFPLALQPSLCVLQTSPPTVTTITTVATITTVTSTTTAVIITITNTTATG